MPIVAAGRFVQGLGAGALTTLQLVDRRPLLRRRPPGHRCSRSCRPRSWSPASSARSWPPRRPRARLAVGLRRHPPACSGSPRRAAPAADLPAGARPAARGGRRPTPRAPRSRSPCGGRRRPGLGVGRRRGDARFGRPAMGRPRSGRAGGGRGSGMPGHAAAGARSARAGPGGRRRLGAPGQLRLPDLRGLRAAAAARTSGASRCSAPPCPSPWRPSSGPPARGSWPACAGRAGRARPIGNVLEAVGIAMGWPSCLDAVPFWIAYPGHRHRLVRHGPRLHHRPDRRRRVGRARAARAPPVARCSWPTSSAARSGPAQRHPRGSAPTSPSPRHQLRAHHRRRPRRGAASARPDRRPATAVP